MKNTVFGELPLEELRQNSYDDYHIVGITINIPRVYKYTQLPYKKQQAFIVKLLQNNIKRLPYVIHYTYIWELSEDLTPHLHGDLKFNKSLPESKVLISMSDLYKYMFNDLSSRHAFKYLKHVNNSYYPEFKRIYTPLLTLQYMKNKEEYDRWITYKNKYQDNIN